MAFKLCIFLLLCIINNITATVACLRQSCAVSCLVYSYVCLVPVAVSLITRLFLLQNSLGTRLSCSYTLQLGKCNLIHRPSHCPVFDHLQYEKRSGEGLVHSILCMMSVGRQRGRGLPSKEQAWGLFLYFLTKCWSFKHSQNKNILLLDWNKERMRKMLFVFDWGPPRLPRHWRHSRDKMNQAFLLLFCILQAIKNWTVEWG